MFFIKQELLFKIKSLINSKVEGDYWDFKQEWHSDNERLLLDILCLANTVHNEDCYLLFGVADDGEVVGLSADSQNRKKQADVLDFMSNTMFAGDNIPKIEVETIIVQGKEVDVLTVYNSYDVPYYLKPKNKGYKKIKPNYIYSRVGDRNTPIDQNSHYKQIELLWKKRLGLLSPPLIQIVNRLRDKLEWEKLDCTYYNIYNPDFKLVEEWDIEDRIGNKRPFYSYNQCNESTSFSSLKILFRETILKEFEIVILDSGRYSTPTPEFGFIHDPVYKSQSSYVYRYILKNSIDYVIQQFLYDENNQEQKMAKYRFDEVVLYFENEEEQLEFNKTIEDNPDIVKQYIEDYKLGYYNVDSNNELEVKDATEKLVTGFAFNKFLSDFRRKKQGVAVKRIKSARFISESMGLICLDEISKHELDINESGTVKHSVYKVKNKSPVDVYKYKKDKYWMREFLYFLEPITTDWKSDYSVEVCDGHEWEVIIKYTDKTSKKIKGTILPPPDGKEVERRIKVLANFENEPFIF